MDAASGDKSPKSDSGENTVDHQPEVGTDISDTEKMDVSTEENICEGNGIKDAAKSDAPSKGETSNDEMDIDVPQDNKQETAENADNSPPPLKITRRRSSAVKPASGDSPDVTSRYGRTRKPKVDGDDFLPTDAVLGKSPKKSKKLVDAPFSSTPSSENSAVKTNSDLNNSLEDSFSAEAEPVENGKSGDEPTATSDSAEEGGSVEEEFKTDYEPGDLIWGRLGHHPFWPCIIINDPVDLIYYKLTGKARLSYHVLFYGDNGKRSWVPSSMIIRFLGLSDFEAQAAAITPEMKKNNSKWFSGFFVKPNRKPIWEAAAREAEEVMPLTRDERLDAFLATMRQMKGRKSKSAEDNQEVNKNDSDDEREEGDSAKSPTSGRKKKKLIPQTESPPTEKKKRGRPRKILNSSTPSDLTPEPVARSTPGPGRGRKRKLLADPDATQDKNDDPDWKAGKKKRKKIKKKEKKSVEDKAFSLFSEKHLDRIHDDHPNMTDDEAQKYLLLLWDKKDEDERNEYIRMVDDQSEDESGSEEDEEEYDDDDDEEENDGRDDTGVEEEVATVASADSGKEASDDFQSIVTSKKVNLFRGFKMERVCQGCEKSGNTVKCRGPCSGVFHVECALGADNSVSQFRILKEGDEKPKKRGRKKKVNPSLEIQEAPKSKAEKRRKNIYAAENTDSDLDYSDGEKLPETFDNEAVLRMMMGDAATMPEVSILTQEVSEDDEEDADEEKSTGGPLVISNSSITDFRCGDCAMYRTPLCFVCGQASVPSGEDSTRVRCSVAHCGKHYHIECLKVLWPQATYSSHNGVFQNLSCPQHVCHTCVSDNPRDSKGRFSQERLVRCIRCPTSYHYGNYCVPAGSEILTATQIICPRHYEPPKKGIQHINASWCFICSIGGSLICCDLCPSSFHVDCLKIKPPTGSFICEDCETGRFPLYNEVLWVKFANYRWWPALTLFPSEIPDNVKSLPHKIGEFAVRFLGTNDHYWIARGRCFVYHEGDSVQDGKKTTKTHMESSYHRGVLEANELHKAHKEMRSKIQTQSKSGPMKPPQYVKIKTNKPVGSVKIIEIDTSNISQCECKPDAEHPCSPDSECLNRILKMECDPNTCPAGEKCENQLFEKRVYPALAPCWTEGRGWGLKILEDIKKGGFIIEYVGEVIDDEEYQRRLLKKHEEKDENYYFLTIDSTRIIDAGPKGNVSRFMNHSCEPNCETQKWTVAGDTRVGLFALTDISGGTELTFNYNLESKGNEKKPCMCGASACSGFIGAKKNKVPQSDVKELPPGKKKRRKPRTRNFNEDICLLCDADKEVGALISCINKECASKYHLPCLGLSSTPLGKWLCPRHRCNVCQKKTQQWCSYCTESYCPAHLGENLINDPLHGDICEKHQKNPLSKEEQKIKRDEERKRKEEEKIKLETEKKKQYEEERARRRSRREQISSEEEAAKVQRSHSDFEDAGSEASMSSEDKPRYPSMEERAVMDEGLAKDDKTEVKDESISERKERKPRKSWKGTSKVKSSPELKSPVVSKRGRKKKVILSEEDCSVPSTQVKKEDTNEGHTQRIEDDLKEINNGIKAAEDEESHINSTGYDDSFKDEIPDADPSLDKFIVETPAPIEDEPLPKSPHSPSLKKLKLSSPKSARAVSVESSPGSISKRRRKPPVHNTDYISSQSLNLKSLRDTSSDKPDKSAHIRKPGLKKHRETDFDKFGLMDELEDVATGFASDDGLESPKMQPKKTSNRGRGKRLSLGMVRSRTADSTTRDTSDFYNDKTSSPHTLKSPGRLTSPMNSMKSPVGYHHSPNTLKSPVSQDSSPSSLKSPGSGLGSPRFESPEKLSASKIFAMQRAKGLKVMPPNRRLSLAREQALNAHDEVPDKIERSGKGLKIMKGRRFSAESNANEKKTENLHGEVLQTGGLKKIRPVLSKVEDNGVSVEEELEEKVAENGSLPLPKTAQPHPMQSPPNKKLKPSSPKKKSPTIGVSSLWNTDILDILK